MNILFISAVFPYPLYSGGQVRIYNLLKLLSKKHKITLFSFTRDETENQWIDKLSFCHHVEMVHRGRAWQPHLLLRSIFGKYPFLLTTYDNHTMRSQVSQALREKTFDLVHLEPGYVWPSLPNVSLPIVISEHNIEHTVYAEYVYKFPFVPLRPALYYDVLKLLWWEKYMWHKATKVTTVSQKDAFTVESALGKDTVTIVPNGVDLTMYMYKHKKLDPKSPVFLFVGFFGWLQNRDALLYILQELWPVIIKKYPGACLRVVGRRMPESLKRRVKTSSSVSLLDNINNIQDAFHRSDILLAPIRMGGGTKFKILEAMACGVPVITTTKGALGLQVRNGEELMIADTISGQMKGIGDLVEVPGHLEHVAKSARQCVERYYSWEHIAKILDSVWRYAHESA